MAHRKEVGAMKLSPKTLSCFKILDILKEVGYKNFFRGHNKNLVVYSVNRSGSCINKSNVNDLIIP